MAKENSKAAPPTPLQSAWIGGSKTPTPSGRHVSPGAGGGRAADLARTRILGRLAKNSLPHPRTYPMQIASNLPAPGWLALAAALIPTPLMASQAGAPAGPQAIKSVKVITRTDSGAQIAGRDVITEVALPASHITAAASGLSPDQLSGFPVQVGGHPNFSPSRGAALADLDGDGLPEIVVSAVDGNVYAFDSEGDQVPGFPVSTIQIPQYAPSIADLEGDGDYEIVQFTRGFTSGGRVYVIDHQGNVAPGYPKSINNSNLAGSPTLFDLDDDGTLEILVPERDYPIGFLRVLEPDGTEWTNGNWPVVLDHVPTGSPAVGDIDGDGSPEVVYLSYESIFAVETDGSAVPGWPVSIGGGNRHSYTSPALADLDGDGTMEIAVGSHQGNSGYFVFEHDGTLRTGWPRSVGTWTYGAPTIVDLDGDGDLEILGSRAGTGITPSNQLFAFNEDGTNVPGWPFSASAGGFGGGSEGPVTVADIDGDGRMEVFSDRSVLEGGNGYLWGLDADGNQLPGFPLRPRGFTYFNGAAIDDIDGDGDFELVALSTVDQLTDINVYDLDGSHSAKDSPWPAYHISNRRGGTIEERPELSTRALWASGSNVSVDVLGDPGELVVLAFSQSLAPALQVGSGWFYTRPFRRLANSAPIPADGQLSVPIPLPALSGLTFYFQAIKQSGGSLSVTNLIRRTIQ